MCRPASRVEGSHVRLARVPPQGMGVRDPRCRDIWGGVCVRERESQAVRTRTLSTAGSPSFQLSKHLEISQCLSKSPARLQDLLQDHSLPLYFSPQSRIPFPRSLGLRAAAAQVGVGLPRKT